MKRFWNWTESGSQVKNEEAGRILYFDGVIAEETWYQDDITPALFREELMAGDGPVTIFLNSPGGCCFAASQIYTMLMEYPRDVTIKIDGIAASAASVIAMAGTKMLMAPTALLFVHNPLTRAMGNIVEMQKAIQMLDEVKESIINAYQIKTGLDRESISSLMDAETWISANKAVELGFADGLLEQRESFGVESRAINVLQGFAFSPVTVTNSLLDKLKTTGTSIKADTPAAGSKELSDLEKRLELLR